MKYGFGRARGGVAERTEVDGHVEHAITLFQYACYVPLAAIQSYWMRDGEPIAIAPHRGSIARARARSLDPIVALIALVLGSTYPLLWLVATVFAISAIRARLPSKPSARALRRGAFHVAVYGTRCDPAYLSPARRYTLATALDERWSAIGGGRTAEDVARLGARTRVEAATAYMMLRLAALDARGASARALLAAADRIADGAILPSELDGPFRSVRAGRRIARLSIVEPPLPEVPRLLAPFTRGQHTLITTMVWAGAVLATTVGIKIVTHAHYADVSDVECATITRIGATDVARCEVPDTGMMYVSFAGAEVPHDHVRGVISAPRDGEVPVLTLGVDDGHVRGTLAGSVLLLLGLVALVLTGRTVLRRRR